MTNKNISIIQKIRGERSKEVWIIKDKEGNILDSFRQKIVALANKRRLEKERFGEELLLERDNSYRENLKRNL